MKKLTGKFLRNKITGEMMFYTDDSMLKFNNLEIVEFVNGEEVGKRTIKVDDKPIVEPERLTTFEEVTAETLNSEDENILQSFAKKGKKAK